MQRPKLAYTVYGSESLNAYKAIEEKREREESEAVDIMCVKGSLNTHNAMS